MTLNKIAEWYDGLGLITKIVGIIFSVLVLILPILGSMFSSIGNVERYIYGETHGQRGYVYYEVADNREPTPPDGQFYLLRSGDGQYKDLSLGDMLQATGPVYFRTSPDPSASQMGLIDTKDCLIVLSTGHPYSGPLRDKVQDKDGAIHPATSAGWVWVAESRCSGV